MPNESALRKKIVLCVLGLLVLGHIMLFSATGVMGLQRFGSEFHYVIRQGGAALAGLVGIWLLSRIPTSFWARIANPLILIQTGLCALTHWPVIGKTSLGAARWLEIGGFSFQPSEFAKITVPIYLAKLLAMNEGAPFSWRQWVRSLSPFFLLLIIILKQPDLGTTLLLGSVFLGLLFLAGMRPVYLFSGFVLACTVFAVSTLHSDYRRRRFMAFVNPWLDPQGSGFQMIQSFISFHVGGLFGVGLGNGNSKLFFLPEVHTDFIFALIGEELGFVGAALVVVAFAYLSYLLFKASFSTSESFSRYLAFALSLIFILQVIVNLGGVTGLVPAKGLPLPFLSWGRSALLSNLAVIGLLLGLLRSKELQPPPIRSYAG